MKKKLLIMLFLSLFLLGCVNREDGVQRYAWPLGTASPDDTVTNIYAEKFAQEVNRLSNGKMKIQVYGNGIIGGDRELLESSRDGDIPFIVQNTAPQVPFMPEIAVFDLPSAFSNIVEVRNAIDNPYFYDQIQQIYQKAGYKLLGYADQGFRVMSTNKKITCLEDFKGQKIRTMENSFHLLFWKSINANPAPMSFSEVYIGLQQGTIDAQENPYEVIVSSKLFEQQKYIVETNHIPHLISLIVNDKFYNNLPKEQQKIIDKASIIAKDYARNASDNRIADKIRKIEESGTEITQIPSELKNEIEKRAKPVYELIRKQVGDEIFNSYYTLKNK